MEYNLINSSISSLSTEGLFNYDVKKEAGVFKKFIAWCDAQQSNHFLWLALTFFIQIGFTLPLTAAFIMLFGGNNSLLWIIMIAVNVPVLALTLAALPTKTRLPFVFFAWLTQAVIIMYCIGFALVH